jgi:hypothetical protein
MLAPLLVKCVRLRQRVRIDMIACSGRPLLIQGTDAFNVVPDQRFGAELAGGHFGLQFRNRRLGFILPTRPAEPARA